jgi:hypothetical protein
MKGAEMGDPDRHATKVSQGAIAREKAPGSLYKRLTQDRGGFNRVSVLGAGHEARGPNSAGVDE